MATIQSSIHMRSDYVALDQARTVLPEIAARLHQGVPASLG